VSNKLADLARLRESLILRSGGQRERLAEDCERLARSLQWAHIAKGLIRKIKDNPGALLGVTAFLGSRRTKFLRVSNWLSIGWALFQALRARRARRRR
jgi:hypothetical protein